MSRLEEARREWNAVTTLRDAGAAGEWAAKHADWLLAEAQRVGELTAALATEGETAYAYYEHPRTVEQLAEEQRLMNRLGKLLVAEKERDAAESEVTRLTDLLRRARRVIACQNDRGYLDAEDRALLGEIDREGTKEKPQ